MCRVWCQRRVAAAIAFWESASNGSSLALDRNEAAMCWAKRYWLEPSNAFRLRPTSQRKSTEQQRHSSSLPKTSNNVDVFRWGSSPTRPDRVSPLVSRLCPPTTSAWTSYDRSCHTCHWVNARIVRPWDHRWFRERQSNESNSTYTFGTGFHLEDRISCFDEISITFSNQSLSNH